MKYLILILVLIVIGIEFHKSSAIEVQCRGENNKNVDWYIVYKLPKIRETSNALIRKGVAYLYITSDDVSSGWKLSTKDISADDSILAHTLDPLYRINNNSSFLWILYNDQPPNKSGSSKYGHAKGVVMTNENQGFWLIHSVPNFPPATTIGEKPGRRKSSDDIKNDDDTKKDESKKSEIPEGKYFYPMSGKQYGQSFLCISLDKSQMDVVGEQLKYNQIIVYKNNVPESLKSQYPTLTEAANQKRIKNAPFNRKTNLQSIKSQEFISFAKSDKWQKDLYDDFVAPQLQSDLLAETWLNGAGRLPTECNGTKVYNIESINLKEGNVNFKSSHDHSKWAVTFTNKNSNTWVCIGDINRADTQFSRGGGTVCLKSLKLWQSYRDAVNDIEPCPKRPSMFQRIRNFFG